MQDKLAEELESAEGLARALQFMLSQSRNLDEGEGQALLGTAKALVETLHRAGLELA